MTYNIPLEVHEHMLTLTLYITGMSPKSMEAIENIKKICSENLGTTFELEIVDLYKHPELAAEQKIVFSPSLIKSFPPPKTTMVGNFSNKEKVIMGLGIKIKE